jgi:alpha-methylacyl-CoA racemase
MVAIVGAPGERAEEPGHDLTYLADAGLVTGLDLPATLFADMGGALMASEAVLKAVLVRQTSGKGSRSRRWRCRTPPPGSPCPAPGA